MPAARDQLNIRVPPDQLARWRAACAEAGVDISATLRDAMDAWLAQYRDGGSLANANRLYADIGRRVAEIVRARLPK